MQECKNAKWQECFFTRFCHSGRLAFWHYSIPAFSFAHSFIRIDCSRHTFGTIALELGVLLEGVQKIMGHKNISTTKRYAKVVDAFVKKGMMMMDGI